MSSASIAVVIPTFNRLELLRDTLRSVEEQQLRPDRIIVVDDGSTDGTAAWLSGREDVTVIRNEEGGWGPARGRAAGAAAAGTELIAFLDSDDLLLPSALADLAPALVAQPEAPFAFGQSLVARRESTGWRPRGLIGPESTELTDLLPALFARNFVSSVGTLVRSSALRRIGGYPLDVAFAEDHYLWIRLAQLGEPVYVPRLTAVYRDHGDGRHTPALADREKAAFLRLADTDPRLSPARARRVGVAMTETSSHLLPAHPLIFLRTVVRALRGRPEKLVALSTAGRFWHRRRSREGAGIALWDEDPDLRRLLARY